jgi:hypothetical protein
MIIPLQHGYVVTDGCSVVRTFHVAHYGSRELCRVAAVAFSYQIELYYPQVRVLLRRIVQGQLYDQRFVG